MAGNGGKRAGAGRKSNAQKALEQAGAVRDLANWFIPSLQESVWKRLVHSKDEAIQYKAISYLSDRMYGKAAQSLEIEGSVEVIKRVVADI